MSEIGCPDRPGNTNSDSPLTDAAGNFVHRLVSEYRKDVGCQGAPPLGRVLGVGPRWAPQGNHGNGRLDERGSRRPLCILGGLELLGNGVTALPGRSLVGGGCVPRIRQGEIQHAPVPHRPLLLVSA